MQMMARETRLRAGPVDIAAFGYRVMPGHLKIEGDSFLFETPEGLRFAYSRGQGVTVDRSAASDISHERLWLDGSVYAAVASINGLLPIHASAVAHGGRVFAFTGPSGAGKSTLVTALGNHGLPMFCDDTLVLDLSDPERVVCLPGHKRLKLTVEAIALTGAESQESVGNGIGKVYARPPAGDVAMPLPLAELVFLEEGDAAQILPIRGAARILRLQDEHYTAYLFAAARRFDRASEFDHLARLAPRFNMARFVRPRDVARFDDGVALAARYVKRESSAGEP